MPWVQLDDGYAEHPKIDSLSDGAFRLHTAAICYANRYQTDGIIPAEKAPRLMPRFRKTYIQELVDRMLWHDIGDGAAYEIHDFLDWNRSREQIAEDKKRASESGKKGAQKRWGTL